MAIKRLSWLCLALLAALVVSLAGCGLKTPPVPSADLRPDGASEISAVAMEGGVQVSFWVPKTDVPSRRLVEATVFRGYLPLDGDEACPPCPPRLTKRTVFDLTKHLENMDGGRFSFLDTDAPQGRQAVYQVVVKDAAGRESNPSYYVRAYRVSPPAVPQGVKAQMLQSEALISWQPVEASINGQPLPEPAGYIIWRKGPEGVKRLSERSQTSTSLTDKTVMAGQTYAYQVAAVRRLQNTEIPGQPSAWLLAGSRDVPGLKPPSDLAGVFQGDGVYLRFTPSPDQDTKGYFIERASKKEGPFLRLNPKAWLENTYVDKTTAPGVYYYRVLAVDDHGVLSPASNWAEVRHPRQ